LTERVPEIPLGELIQPANDRYCGSQRLPVASMTRSQGLVAQTAVFKKRIASTDIARYRVVSNGQLAVGIHIDEGAIGVSSLPQDHAVSPAYSVWELRDPSRMEPAFLDRFVRSPAAIRYFISHYRKTADRRGKLTRDRFLALPIPLPPLAEQRRIADILDRADALRAKRRDTPRKLANLAAATFDGWFGPNDTSSYRPLREAFAESPNYGSMIPPSDSGDWLALRVGNIQDSRLDLRDRKYVNLPIGGARERHTVRDGDLLMARAIASQAHLGKCIVAHPGQEQWAFDSHLMRIRLDKEILAPYFLQQWLKTARGRASFLRVARKSVVQFNVNTKEIASLLVPMPSIADQSRFVGFLRQAERIESAAESSLTALDSLFVSLQQRAFRGEL
jgi:type I restriction enzyme S subunit